LDNLEEYKKFKYENSVVTEYNFWKESKNLHTFDFGSCAKQGKVIKQGSSVNFEDS